MAYADLNTIHNPTAGQVPPASWGDQIRDNFEFLIDPPACSVYNSAAQTIANATTTSMTADSENFDNNSMHSTSTNTSRITFTTAGRYLCFATVQFAADVDGVRNVKFRINGATEYECVQVPAVSSVSSIVITATRAFVFAASDYVECRVSHTAGNNLSVTLLEFGATFLTR